MEPAIPRPNNNGKTMTLAKLNGRLNSTEAAKVNKAASRSGAKISAISRMLCVRARTRITINTKVIAAAALKAWMTVLPASIIITGVPVAAGAI